MLNRRAQQCLAGVCILAGSIAGVLVPALSAAPKKFHHHGAHQAAPPEEEGDPAEVTIGERLFLETRFAQFFAASLPANGDVNTPLGSGDPVVDFTETLSAPLPGPFAGESINCRSCHLVDEQLDMPGGGMRTYTDFARRSPVPQRPDGQLTAPRNSPPLVNASLARDGGLLLHFDGEFTTLPDLVVSTMTGRNYGWQPREFGSAIAHVARVVRGDDGSGALAQEFGGLSYAVVLKGTDPSIPAEFRLPKAFRIDVSKASDRAVVDAVAALIAVYTEQLEFSTDEDGAFNLSPYDVFLELNSLPRQPRKRETDEQYSQRLLQLIAQKEAQGTLQFVNTNPNTDSGLFDFHPNQLFTFGATELEGLKIFFRQPANLPLTTGQINAGGIGNCTACHAAPAFTDFGVHNTGATQLEYDALHGAGAFQALNIPGLLARLASHDAYLPATPAHPDALGPFRAVPSASQPALTDLGVWNVLGNPDFPKPQARLWEIICTQETGSANPFLLLGPCNPSAIVAKSIATFKTPGLRDLSHSAPYIHNGQFDTLDAVIDLYRTTSGLARAGQLRNGASDLQGIALTPADVAPLRAFLRALNEDYS